MGAIKRNETGRRMKVTRAKNAEPCEKSCRLFTYSAVGFGIGYGDNNCLYNYSAKSSCVIWSLSHLRGLLLPSIHLTFSSSVYTFLFRQNAPRLNHPSSKDELFCRVRIYGDSVQVLTKHLIYIVPSSMNNCRRTDRSRTCHTFTKLSLSPRLNSFLFISFSLLTIQ